jgi:hypothetical protein
MTSSPEGAARQSNATHRLSGAHLRFAHRAAIYLTKDMLLRRLDLADIVHGVFGDEPAIRLIDPSSVGVA